MKQLLFAIILMLPVRQASAQPTEQLVRVSVVPDADNWQRKVGEPTRFLITVMRDGSPMRNARIAYQVGPERMKPMQTDTIMLTDGRFTTSGHSMQVPGFLRCAVTVMFGGKAYRGLATVGYDIAGIRPTVTRPADFADFWNGVKRDLASVPLDARLTLLPEKGSGSTNVYHVNLQNLGNARLYGMLCVPKKPGRYPAVLQVPGAGIRPYLPDLELADRGVIVFTIGIHGIPVNMEPSVYRDLEAGPLKGYFFFNNYDPDKFYYKRVYAGCIRAVDFIQGLPEYDGERLAVSGNSQGGMLSIVTAAMDKRVKCLAEIHPAFCDLTGYFSGRAGGWPHVFAEGNVWYSDLPAVRRTMPYYDVVNFAKALTVPGWYTWGFNDETCPPTSMHAAYNAITAPKEMALYPETGHWFYPEQRARMNAWLLEQLK